MSIGGLDMISWEFDHRKWGGEPPGGKFVGYNGDVKFATMGT